MTGLTPPQPSSSGVTRLRILPGSCPWSGMLGRVVKPCAACFVTCRELKGLWLSPASGFPPEEPLSGLTHGHWTLLPPCAPRHGGLHTQRGPRLSLGHRDSGALGSCEPQGDSPSCISAERGALSLRLPGGGQLSPAGFSWTFPVRHFPVLIWVGPSLH